MLLLTFLVVLAQISVVEVALVVVSLLTYCVTSTTFTRRSKVSTGMAASNSTAVVLAIYSTI